MLKAGGIWVSPVEIESVLIDHDAVQECAVIGRDDGAWPVEAVRVRGVEVAGDRHAGAGGGAADVRARAASPNTRRPRGVEFVPELPKTATGKLQRFKLRANVEKAGSDPDSAFSLARFGANQCGERADSRRTIPMPAVAST